MEVRKYVDMLESLDSTPDYHNIQTDSIQLGNVDIGVDSSPAAIRLGEVIGWDKVAEMAAERREVLGRVSIRRMRMRRNLGR